MTSQPVAPASLPAATSPTHVVTANVNTGKYEKAPLSSFTGGALVYSTVSALLAGTEAARGTGSTWQAAGYRYQEVTSGQHLTTAGGVKLIVLADNNTYPALAFNPVADGVTDDKAKIDLMNASGVVVDLGGKTYEYGGVFTPVATFINGVVIDDNRTRDFRVSFKADPGRRMIQGFEPEKISGTVLRLQAGSAANIAGAEVASSGAIDIDVTTTGAGGLDTGTVTDGEDYFPYLIRHNTTGALSAVLSAQISTGSVTVPSGYTLWRKLAWGFVYQTDAGWGVTTGIPDFHLSGNGGESMTTYTAFQMAAPFLVLSAGTATSFTAFNVLSCVPDNARYVRLMCQVDYASAAGTAYIRSIATQATGIPVGRPNAAGDVRYFQMDIRCDSAGDIRYKVDSGVTLTVGVMGYYMTEPS